MQRKKKAGVRGVVETEGDREDITSPHMFQAGSHLPKHLATPIIQVLCGNPVSLNQPF